MTAERDLGEVAFREAGRHYGVITVPNYRTWETLPREEREFWTRVARRVADAIQEQEAAS